MLDKKAVDDAWLELQTNSPNLIHLRLRGYMSLAESKEIHHLRNEYNITYGIMGFEFKATILMLLLAEAGEL